MQYLEILYQTFSTNTFDDALQSLDDAHQSLRETLNAPDRKALAALIDGHLLLREQTALAAFADGLRLALFLTAELYQRKEE